MSAGEGLREALTAQVDLWEREGDERGPGDMLYTCGVVDILRALLAEIAPTPDESVGEGQAEGLSEDERADFKAHLRQNLGYRAFLIEDTMVGHVERILAARGATRDGAR